MGFVVSIRIGSCQTCEISERKDEIKERRTEKLLWCSGSSGSHQKAAAEREETINYEYITDENRRLEGAEEGRRTGCQPFIRDIIREVPILWLLLSESSGWIGLLNIMYHESVSSLVPDRIKASARTASYTSDCISWCRNVAFSREDVDFNLLRSYNKKRTLISD